MNCWPWYHRWELWAETERGEVFRYYDPETRVPYEKPMRKGQYLVQQRQCLLCGKVQLRTVVT